jgi:uncharacterized protein (TIGR00255 family)
MKERMENRKVLGIILGLAGTITLILYGKSLINATNASLGNLLVFVNAVSYGFYLIIVKKLMDKYNAFTFVKWIYTFGFLMVLPFGWGEFQAIDFANLPTDIFWKIGFVVVFSTFLTYLLNLVSMRELKPTTVAVFIYLQPLFATIFAVSLGKDDLSLVKLISAVLIDLNTRMPSVFREMELGLRNQISQRLERGKVDFSLYVEVTGEETTSKINVPIIKGYINQMKAVIPTADETELMKMAVRMPDALKTERDEIDENEWKQIQTVIDEALENIANFRKDEGASLEKEFQLRIGNINNLMNEAVSYDAERVETVKTRLRTALDEIKVNVDENRFEQELIFYLEKYDITEEKVRLGNHLNYFLETLNGTEANGRKLGFITQEMGREINTMGSKSNHTEMQKLVVMMKDELEKIKEQVLNVL